MLLAVHLCLLFAVKGIGTLQLLNRSFVAPQDILYISVGRWHANNCEGVGSNFPSILRQIGRFARDTADTLPNILFSPSPFDHVQCGAKRYVKCAGAGCVLFARGVHEHPLCSSHSVAGPVFCQLAPPHNREPLLPPSGVCVPHTQGNYSLEVWQQVRQMTKEILGDTYSVPLIDTYQWTLPLYWAHIPLATGWDCLHYCR